MYWRVTKIVEGSPLNGKFTSIPWSMEEVDNPSLHTLNIEGPGINDVHLALVSHFTLSAFAQLGI
jgi:hypothetical protein